MAEYNYNTSVSNLELRGGSFNPSKPVNNSPLSSSEMRDNFFGLDLAIQDLRYRSFSNNAVGKSTFNQNVKTDYPREFVAVHPIELATVQLGSPLLTGWLTPQKIGNTVIIQANIFGQFDENISFHVTRANYAFDFNPDTNPNAHKWYEDSAYLAALQVVHPRVAVGSHYTSLAQNEALCTARTTHLNGTEGQIISLLVQDTVSLAKTGWAYTIWAKATAGIGGRVTLDSADFGKQGFVLNRTDPYPIGLADYEYGISTLLLTEVWSTPE